MRRVAVNPFFIVFLTLLSLGGYAYSQADESILKQKVDDGIYENESHFYIFRDNLPVSTVLKSFYGFWYDGIYPLEENAGESLIQLDDDLYLSFWLQVPIDENVASGGTFWAPGSNIRELSITPYPVNDRLSGWFIVHGPPESEEEPEMLVYEIPYWQADVEYADELASFTLPDGNEAYVKKLIKLGDTVYTCAAGRRKKVRNPFLRESLPEHAVLTSEGTVMVTGMPYLSKADVADISAEIMEHNSITYPPRFSTLDTSEPSIYKKLEDMPIEW